MGHFNFLIFHPANFSQLNQPINKMKKIQISLFILFVLSLATGFAQSGKPLFTHAIGVQFYTYRNSLQGGLGPVLDSIKALGITEIEGSTPKNTTAEEFKKMYTDRGLTMPSIGWDYNMILKDPMAAVTEAKAYGSKFIMVAWIPHGKDFTIDDAKKAVADFNTVGKILHENGITLCYHDHGYEFGPYGDGTLFDSAREQTDPQSAPERYPQRGCKRPYRRYQHQ